MNTAFVLCGTLIVVGSIATRALWPTRDRRRSRTGTTIASSVLGLGMVLDGLFTLESVMLHLLGFLLAVGGAVVAFVLSAYSLRPALPGTSTALLVLAGLTVALFVGFMAIFDPYNAGDNSGVAGLVQRMLVLTMLGGITFLTLRLRALD